MLHLSQNNTGVPRLYVRYPAPRVDAWIEPYHSRSFRSGPDWVLWYRRSPHQPAAAHRSQLRLEIEGVLRSWLLRTHHRRLYAMSFGDLCALAEASRRYRRPHEVR